MRYQISLVNKSSHTIDFNKLSITCRDLQIQLDRDLFPLWGIQAQITPLNPHDSISDGVWPIYILDQSDAGLGVHLDNNGNPFAEVKYDLNSWDNTTITISHEMLEMLVDPLGNNFKSAPDLDPNSDRHLVKYLEVGDPCEMFSYNIGNTIVSDFITPQYYDVNADSNIELDLLRKLHKPLEVPLGGYISFEDPKDDHWHQKDTDGNLNDLGPINHNENPRENRDNALGGDDFQDNRHDLSPILTAYQKRWIAK